MNTLVECCRVVAIEMGYIKKKPTIAAIVKGGRTGEEGEIGDGKIFILPMDECVRIRTGERGREAI